MAGFWLLLIFLVIFILAIPSWPYSRGWGYYPSGLSGLVFIILLLLVFFGVLSFSWPWAPVAVVPVQ